MIDSNLRNREFLGQGLAFPLQVDPRGGLALVGGERDIEIEIWFKGFDHQVPGPSISRPLMVMRPEFGCRVHELVFAPNNAATEGLLIHYVKEALDRWEPRIEVLTVDVSADPGSAALLTEIKYLVRDTHHERSIVYPFYLMGEEE